MSKVAPIIYQLTQFIISQGISKNEHTLENSLDKLRNIKVNK